MKISLIKPGLLKPRINVVVINKCFNQMRYWINDDPIAKNIFSIVDIYLSFQIAGVIAKFRQVNSINSL